MNKQAGYIYLIKADEHYKIGKSTNVAQRMRQFQFPFPIELLHTIAVPDMTGAENYLHRRFANQRIHGEWFALSPEDVASVCAISSLDSVPELPKPPEQKPEFYTVEEVAQIFRVSPQTIRSWVRAGKLSSVRLGRSHLIHVASVDQLREVNSGSFGIESKKRATEAVASI
jgi:excisionase family DNA binding protein